MLFHAMQTQDQLTILYADRGVKLQKLCLFDCRNKIIDYFIYSPSIHTFKHIWILIFVCVIVCIWEINTYMPEFSKHAHKYRNNWAEM